MGRRYYIDGYGGKKEAATGNPLKRQNMLWDEWEEEREESSDEKGGEESYHPHHNLDFLSLLSKPKVSIYMSEYTHFRVYHFFTKED